MKEPLVCAVMLTKDRPDMAARAVRSFRAQTYQNKRLLIWDSSLDKTSDEGLKMPLGTYADEDIPADLTIASSDNKTIGALRNAAIAGTDAEIIIHWDDDDVSHPNRIAEQVALLQVFDADVVGYGELLFWRESLRDKAMAARTPSGGWTRESLAAVGIGWPPPSGWLKGLNGGEAWLYKTTGQSKPPGTSLCYWRKTWERKPFPNLSTGEDSQWQRGLDVETRSSITDGEPRLIASIHGGNTAPYDIEAQIERGAHLNWKRAPEWDKFCSERMAL